MNDYSKENYIGEMGVFELQKPDTEHRHYINFLDTLTEYYDNNVIVDLGCHRGPCIGYIAENYNAKTLIGIDINSEAIELAKKDIAGNNKYDNVYFYCNNFIDLNSIETDSVDFAFSFHSFEHLYPADELLAYKEVNRILKCGGTFLLTSPFEGNYPDPNHVSTEFSFNKLDVYFNSEKYEKVMEKMEKIMDENGQSILYMYKKKNFTKGTQ